MGDIKPDSIVFGEFYGDQSGYEWRVALVRGSDGTRRVEIGEGDHSAWIDPESVSVRDVASAIYQIANLLGEPE